MNQKQFTDAIKASTSRLSGSMRKALEDILLHGKTWREASIDRGVTESGILRAMRRLGLR